MGTRNCVLIALQALKAEDLHTFKMQLKSERYRACGPVCHAKLEEAKWCWDVLELLVTHYTEQCAPFVALRLLGRMGLKQQQKELREALAEVKNEKPKKEQRLSKKTMEPRSMNRKEKKADAQDSQVAAPGTVKSIRAGCPAPKRKSSKVPATSTSVTRKTTPASDKRPAPKANQDLKAPPRKPTTAVKGNPEKKSAVKVPMAEKNAKSIRGSATGQKVAQAPQGAVRKIKSSQ